MKAFTDLYTALDETTKTNEKIAAMKSYFESASPEDSAWAIYFLTGRKPKQLMQIPKLVALAVAAAGVPGWMFAESYDAVGDTAETIALLLPDSTKTSELPLSDWVENRLLPLRGATEQEQIDSVLEAWQELNDQQRFIWNKLLTGAFRVGVSQQLVIRALSLVSKIEPAVVAHRLMGTWEPTAEFYQHLMEPDTKDTDISRPYPFYLAYPFENDLPVLGEVSEWQAEWKWDGIRSQLIRRGGQSFIWSRGEELISDRFPELIEESVLLPDGTVIDGEILPWKEANVLPFSQLQLRIGRKNVSKKMMEDVPVIIMAYDLLEFGGVDIRDRALVERRELLERLLRGLSCSSDPAQLTIAESDKAAPFCQRLSERLRISPKVEVDSWEALSESRNHSRSLNVEGLMLKRLSSPYKVGRQRGDWWKWKVNPFTMDAVLIYAQRGSGKRASLYTDYTFGLWDNGKLVPVAKAYSGLTDEEIRQVDLFVRQNTLEKFGPVRTVKPELVFELAFEGIAKSTRHKSGIAVRFPRMLRWRTDKPANEADTLETVQALL
ncbi:MAG: ATP-dependent DNA ligase [Cyanobacteria bacterium SZAS-4]|nr:ATP-dependent DNA ligase [Cyanobacteria bacterium SZAS-4]